MTPNLNGLLPPPSRRYLGNYEPSETPTSWRTPVVNLLIFAAFVVLLVGTVTAVNHRATIRAWANRPLWVWEDPPKPPRKHRPRPEPVVVSLSGTDSTTSDTPMVRYVRFRLVSSGDDEDTIRVQVNPTIVWTPR